MRKISLEANAKINLGLDVVGLREDGYHEVRMVMQSLELCDTIELEKTDGGIEIQSDSENLPPARENICYKAAELMLKEYGLPGGLEISIKKRIPIAAGLAGGSTDAAAVFLGTNELFGLGLSKEELLSLGVKVGADVPFCIAKGAALSEGIGEKLTGLKNLPECGIILFKPEISVSTADVYRKIDKTQIKAHPDIDALAKAMEEGSLKRITGLMGNVLELVTEAEHPVITTAKQEFMDHGALGAMMSGSGPTVFGIFEDRDSAGKCYDLLKEKLAGTLILTGPAS